MKPYYHRDRPGAWRTVADFIALTAIWVTIWILLAVWEAAFV